MRYNTNQNPNNRSSNLVKFHKARDVHVLLVILLSSVKMSQLSAAIQLKKKNIQHHRPALAAYPYAPEKFLLLCSFLQLFRPTHAARPSLAHTIVHTFAHLLNISRLRIHNEQH